MVLEGVDGVETLAETERDGVAVDVVGIGGRARGVAPARARRGERWAGALEARTRRARRTLRGSPRAMPPPAPLWRSSAPPSNANIGAAPRRHPPPTRRCGRIASRAGRRSGTPRRGCVARTSSPARSRVVATRQRPLLRARRTATRPRETTSTTGPRARAREDLSTTSSNPGAARDSRDAAPCSERRSFVAVECV